MEHGRASDLSILTRLAVGGMAEIFLARRAAGPGAPPGTNGQLVVVKRILPQYAEEGRFLRMLFDEAAISQQLQHPNIVKVFGLSRGGGEAGYSLIMEYVPGESVARLLRAARLAKKTVPVPISAYVAEQVAAALDYAHALTDGRGVHMGLVHRDITPGNVMIGDDGSVKVLDFGIARAHGRFDKTASSDIRKGTLGYMAPEYYRSGALDRRADVFSLGVVLFEMLTMTHPFDAPNEMAMVQKILRGEMLKLEKLLPSIPQRLAAAVNGALVLDPDRRFQTAGEMRSALQAYLATVKPAVGREDLARLVQEFFSVQIEARKKLMSMPPPAPAPAPASSTERAWSTSSDTLSGSDSSWGSGNTAEPGAITSLRSGSSHPGPLSTGDRHYIPDADESFDDVTIVQDPMELGLGGLGDSGRQSRPAERRPSQSFVASDKIVVDDAQLAPAPSGASPLRTVPAQERRVAEPPKRSNRPVWIALAVGSAVLAVGIAILVLFR